MAKLKVKKGDTVVVISGRDKVKQGEVLRVFPAESRLIVQGVHVAHRHTRQSMTSQGGIVDKELTIHVSNVAHIDPSSGRPTRTARSPPSSSTRATNGSRPPIRITLRSFRSQPATSPRPKLCWLRRACPTRLSR